MAGKHDLVPYAARSMTVEQREKLIRSVSSMKSAKRRDKEAGHSLTGNLMKSGGSLGAGLLAGYLWKSQGTTDPKIAGKVPYDWAGAAAGLALQYFGIGGPTVAGIAGAVGNGFLTLIGVKLVLGMGDQKKTLAIAGDDSAGADPSMGGADPDLV